MMVFKLVLFWIALLISVTAAKNERKWENDDFRCIFFCKCQVLEGKKVASCTHKNIHRPPINGFPLPGGTEVVDLSFNRFYVLRSNAFAQIHRKGLKMEELRVLNISNNRIQRISTKALLHIDNLKILDLSRNNMQVIHPKTFMNLSKLEELYLQHNEIKSLPEYAFEGLRSLKILDLSFGKLTQIDWWAFSMSDEPTLLNLNNNNLSTFHSNYIFIPDHLHFKIDLTNNPIECDCALQRFFKDHYYYGDDGNVNLTCTSPSTLKGYNFSSLLLEDFSGCVSQRQILSNYTSPVMGVVNTTTRLTCKTIPGPQYKNWAILRRQDDAIEMPDRFTISQSKTWVNLTITNTSQSDAGIYRCETIERVNVHKGVSTFFPVTLKVVNSLN